MIPAIDILENVALAPRTTLELGGPARYYLLARDEKAVTAGVRWAHLRGLPVGILGGGSNLIVSDSGFDGLVIEMALTGIEETSEGERVLVTAAAGEDWDTFVSRTVAAGYAGLECLSGIPGRVGATPIQNVGAYGQEIAETLRSVRVLDREAMQVRTLSAQDCEFAYRDSMFKRAPDRFVVLAVTFALTPGGAPTVRYAELERRLGPGPHDLSTVRETVLALRRAKSMVLDPDDPNRRSAGSFFTNPIVERERAEALARKAVREGLISTPEAMPRWPMDHGTTKLAAGWLIERAGIAKGMRRGQVGVSSRHALALVHHGGGTTAELMELAEQIRAAVHARFGIVLTREPVYWGAAQASSRFQSPSR